MIDKTLIENKLENILKNTEIFLVEIKIIANTQKILIKLDKNPYLSLDDCGLVHRQLYAELETIYETFELEISSPGIDAFFKVFKQYKKSIGKEVELFTKENKCISGKLIDAVENEYVEIERKNKELVKINFSEINKTKLIISFK